MTKLERRARALLTYLAVWGVCLTASQASAQVRRVNLEVLVLSAGDVGTAMIKAGLDEGLVPYTEIDLNSASRPVINDAFLTDWVSLLVRRANYQAIVMPNSAPSQLSAAELAAIAAYEREFKIRQLDAYLYPTSSVGLSYPVYSGPLDGMTGVVTAAAKAAGFSYLAGPVPFEDLDPSIAETWGYLAQALPPDTVNRRSFTPFVEMPIPGSGSPGVLVGVYQDNGREEMVLTGSMNQNQLQQQILFPGLLSWLTYGVHLGTERNYLSVHIDDVFLSDARWSVDANCTVGDDCPLGVLAPDVLMTPADVDHLVAWQARQGLKLDMVFNGFGYDAAIAENGSYPLGAQLLANRSALRWVNHTYSHLYIGCIQDFSVLPWRCATNSSGQVQWTPYASVYNELSQNLSFASRMGLSIVRTELVTGEHSGLRRAPQEPSDNPYLAQAISALRLGYVGSDSSRESEQRSIGSALTVPRYPMNIYYNTGTKREATDEYNWIYTSRDNGGSGLCENNPASTCIAPLDLDTGFDAYILPREARTTLLHMVSNSPRPHYAHQSNLAEDRVLYPVLDKALADYRTVFSANTPVVNPSLTQSGAEFKVRAAWRAQRARVSAYVQSGFIVLNVAGVLTSVDVPLTAPTGSVGGTITSYGGLRTGWQSVGSLFGQMVSLPSSVAYPR